MRSEDTGGEKVQRIGVFVCHCGSNIAATVDVKKVVEIIAKEPGVVHAEDYQYMCSEAGQSRIQEAIREKISQEWLSVPVLRVCMRQLSVKQRKRPA